MNEDGTGVPKTLPSNRLAPLTDPFNDSTKTLVQRATVLLDGRPAQARVMLFQCLVSELPMRAISEPSDAPTLAELFTAAFEDPTGAEFWRLRLQPPIGPGQFAEMLATFLAVEGGEKSVHRNAIGEELVRDLTTAGKVPPITRIVDAPVVDYVDPTDGQRHTYTMSPTVRFVGEDFFPEEPLRWMADREWYRNRLLISLLEYLTRKLGDVPIMPPTPAVAATALSTSGLAGRPTSRHLIILKLAERGRAGETLPTCKAEAEWLSAWIAREHPGEPQAKAKTLQISIADQYRKIRKSIPK